MSQQAFDDDQPHKTASAIPSVGYSVEVDSVANEAWDEIVAGFADSNPEQTACFARHHWKCRDSHLLLRRDGVPVAGARVALVKLPVVGRGLAFLRFGPFWRRRDAAADSRTYRAMIEALVHEYCDRRGHCLTVLPRPHPHYHGLESVMLREQGFVRRREIRDAERFVVDCSLDEAAQTASLAQKWRYNLRQGLTRPLDVRFTEEPAEIKAFQRLYTTMMERKQFSSTTPVHLTETLMAELPPALKPKLAVAFHEGELVAGATIGLFGDTAYYMFGASSAAALPLHAGYALHWHVAAFLRGEGVHWYDLGGASHEPGLRQFKKGFVGKAGRIVTMEGEHDRWSTSFGRLSADAVFGLRYLQRRIRHGARF
jgi:hypothetical protein